MNVRFDNNFIDFSFHNVAEKIVGKFVNEFHKEINTETLIDGLANQLFKRNLYPSLNKEKQPEIFIPEEAFPETMKAWVVARNALFIETASSESSPEHNSPTQHIESEMVDIQGASRQRKSLKHKLDQQLTKQFAAIEIDTDHNAIGIETDHKMIKKAKKVLPKKQVDEEMEVSSGHGIKKLEQARVEADYTFANSNWSDVEVVVQAKEGVRGAWFFSNAKRGSVVIKSQENSEMQIMGTVFLRCMGMNAPDSRVVARSSEEGQQISSLGNEYGLNARHASQYIVMNRVYGPSYSNLSSTKENIQLVVNNLEKLGELAVYDLILGNYDRFQLDDVSFNSGNIMFQDGILQAIDTDCIYQEEREGFTKLALRKIVMEEGDFHRKISLKLAKNLGNGVDPDLFPASKIQAGMNKAVDNLIKLVDRIDENQVGFNKFCQERGCKLKSFPSHVLELINHVNSCYNKKMKK